MPVLINMFRGRRRDLLAVFALAAVTLANPAHAHTAVAPAAKHAGGHTAGAALSGGSAHLPANHDGGHADHCNTGVSCAAAGWTLAAQPAFIMPRVAAGGAAAPPDISADGSRPRPELPPPRIGG